MYHKRSWGGSVSSSLWLHPLSKSSKWERVQLSSHNTWFNSVKIYLTWVRIFSSISFHFVSLKCQCESYSTIKRGNSARNWILWAWLWKHNGHHNNKNTHARPMHVPAHFIMLSRRNSPACGFDNVINCVDTRCCHLDCLIVRTTIWLGYYLLYLYSMPFLLYQISVIEDLPSKVI